MNKIIIRGMTSEMVFEVSRWYGTHFHECQICATYKEAKTWIENRMAFFPTHKYELREVRRMEVFVDQNAKITRSSSANDLLDRLEKGCLVRKWDMTLKEVKRPRSS